jgi:periplasmic divalent cation tolerance protein
MTDYSVILTTCPSPESAEQIAEILVKSKLAASVNIVPSLLSIYYWQGELQKDEETLLLINTCEERYADIEKVLLAQHPYSVPELVSLPVKQGLAGYLAWVRENSLGIV